MEAALREKEFKKHAKKLYQESMIQVLSEEDEGDQIKYEGIMDNKSERSNSD